MLELVGLAVGDDRVARVRAALVAADEVRVLGEQIDDLPLALVAPLRTDDDCRGHGRSVCQKPSATLLGRESARARVEGPRRQSHPPRYEVATRGRAVEHEPPVPCIVRVSPIAALERVARAEVGTATREARRSRETRRLARLGGGSDAAVLSGPRFASGRARGAPPIGATRDRPESRRCTAATPSPPRC